MIEVIAMRPHHGFLCSLTYQGTGYSPQFVRNFNKVIDAISRGARIWLVSRGDAICKSTLNRGHGACNKNCLNMELPRDQATLQAINQLQQPLGLIRSLQMGDVITLTESTVSALRVHFAAPESILRVPCRQCRWHQLCSDVAAGRYRNVRLYPPPAP